MVVSLIYLFDLKFCPDFPSPGFAVLAYRFERTKWCADNPETIQKEHYVGQRLDESPCHHC